MPPKSRKKAEAASKKNAAKKKDKMVEDKTFGLKNKNKSKKVQMQIDSVRKSVMSSGDPKMRKLEEQRRQAKDARKAAKKAAKDEQDALFGEALMAVKTKTSTKMKGTVEALGRDHGDDDKKGGTSRAMKMMYQMDAQEMEAKLKEDPNYVPTIEDEIEAQRQAKVKALKASGKTGTKVTEKTFREWQERKRKRHADEARKRVEAELKKKKGGKGLAVLSGKDLYEYKKELFRDDDAALADAPDEEEEDGGGGSGGGGEGGGGKRRADDDGNNNGGAGGGGGGDEDEKKAADLADDGAVERVADLVQSDLFLAGDDDDLDDLDDLDDE